MKAAEAAQKPVLKTYYEIPEWLPSDQKEYIDNALGTMVEILRFARKDESTVTDYQTYTKPFLIYCWTELAKPAEQATYHEIRTFLDTIQLERNLSDRTMDHAISQIFSLYALAFERSDFNRNLVPYRKFTQYIAFVPTIEEVEQLINAIDDDKRHVMVIIMYSCGLRISEVCSLKFGDIIKSRKLIHVRPSKNHKDRYTRLPDKCLQSIEDYAQKYFIKRHIHVNSDSWLFTEQKCTARHIYSTYVGDHLKDYEERLGWEHHFTCHTFRRAFATHNFLQGNMTLDELSVALGHSDTRTTMIYVESSALWLENRTHKNAIDSMNI